MTSNDDTDRLVWRGDMAIKVARTPGPFGPGFERDLLISALGYHSHQAVLERRTVRNYGQASWQWRIYVNDKCVAHRLTKPHTGAA